MSQCCGWGLYWHLLDEARDAKCFQGRGQPWRRKLLPPPCQLHLVEEALWSPVGDSLQNGSVDEHHGKAHLPIIARGNWLYSPEESKDRESNDINSHVCLLIKK